MSEQDDRIAEIRAEHLRRMRAIGGERADDELYAAFAKAEAAMDSAEARATAAEARIQALVDEHHEAQSALTQALVAKRELEAENTRLRAALEGLRALILAECPSAYECVDGERADSALSPPPPTPKG